MASLEKISTSIDAKQSIFIQSNSTSTIVPIKCIGLGLYEYEDKDDFAKWLEENPHEEEDIHIQFIEVIDWLELEDDCLDLTTLVDDICINEAFSLKIDRTQVDDLDTIMKEGTIMPFLLQFKRTFQGIEV